ncbi:hypothetical protein CYMTET_33804 [Cymbomonas tetramitiformis]|uniref:Chromo domain-containing protein n=1 Tax=Cymbomonas tetramitiformis TaxID=36881 RepID=A0AAE0FCC7_9CHLO|nr:hypothetical protein CYMTET_33804 [Cymbomonas tetramitiformis]
MSSYGTTLLAQGKGLVKRTQQNPFDPAGSDDFDYLLHEILAERLSGAIPQWPIRWEGLSEHADTWGPIENLAGLEQDISNFRQRRKDEAAAEEAVDKENKRRRQEEKEKAGEGIVSPLRFTYSFSCLNAVVHVFVFGLPCASDEGGNVSRQIVADGNRTS